jgi:acyl-CoA reductase-like NAD-dependent aldehyde dehydrogenase
MTLALALAAEVLPAGVLNVVAGTGLSTAGSTPGWAVA